MKRNSFFSIIFRIVGIVILIVGIRMIAEGTINYIEQHKQVDWITTTAEITDVSSRVKSSGTRRGLTSTVYDITYQYEVDGITYSDEIRSHPEIRLVGDSIKIKYNPVMPDNSTTKLSPSVGDLLVFIIFGAIFGVLGFFLSGLYAVIRRLLRRDKPEEKEELPPEEYVELENTKKVAGPFVAILVRRIIPTIIILGAILLSIKLFPVTQSAGAEQFKNTVEAAGYVTADTTEKLRQDWRVGSMLEEAVSFDDGTIRMDFCVMDSVDSAVNQYNNMTLPTSDGEVLENGGIVHELYSVENSTTYVAKIRIRDTVIYISALAEYKQEVIELLEALGYWKE